MAVYFYDLVNDINGKPKLKTIKRINVSNYVIDSYDQVPDFFNTYFELNRLSREHLFVMSLDMRNRILAIGELSTGSNRKTIFSKRELAIYLLLTGAERFVLIHNHPGGVIDASQEDKTNSRIASEIGKLIHVDFLYQFIVTYDAWNYVEPNATNDTVDDDLPF